MKLRPQVSAQRQARTWGTWLEPLLHQFFDSEGELGGIASHHLLDVFRNQVGFEVDGIAGRE